jgi:hypothetical protein
VIRREGKAVIEAFDKGAGKVLGFRVVGDVSKADYEMVRPAVEAAVDRYGTVRVLIDLTDFHWEKVEAWGADLSFGHTYHHKIERMALVGEQSWGKWLAKLADPFYAQDAKWFEDQTAAWQWLEG